MRDEFVSGGACLAFCNLQFAFAICILQFALPRNGPLPRRRLCVSAIGDADGQAALGGKIFYDLFASGSSPPKRCSRPVTSKSRLSEGGRRKDEG